MVKERKTDLQEALKAGALKSQAPDREREPHPTGHGFEGPVRSKVKGGAHTKAELKRSASPKGDRIGERSRGLS
ncbi:hypothetical protein [Streptomyces bambusae]|uniref:Uncharacterized protein n=1 Tax=Streptomyces bambusae TaxID=1550616 RepID=A0ABS6Z9R2_9ACTN|nr:hypothetical protein [Streptomyces bambusae]MBW5483948.1 hypothetical protein [Streptomyces bambusae]